MRCSIYGKNLNEWDELARWLTANDLHKPLGGVFFGKAAVAAVHGNCSAGGSHAIPSNWNHSTRIKKKVRPPATSRTDVWTGCCCVISPRVGRTDGNSQKYRESKGLSEAGLSKK